VQVAGPESLFQFGFRGEARECNVRIVRRHGRAEFVAPVPAPGETETDRIAPQPPGEIEKFGVRVGPAEIAGIEQAEFGIAK